VEKPVLRAVLNTRRAKLHAAAAVFIGLVMPGAPLLAGSGVFSWNMFSKSSTYRMEVLGKTIDGAARTFDSRAIGPYVNPSLRSFLPQAGRWQHDPVGLTFRTGLDNVAQLACRLAPLVSTEVTLEERDDLDATPRVTVARARCR